LCIPTLDGGVPTLDGSEVSKIKKQLLDKIEFHIVNCECDLKGGDYKFMEECLDQKLNFTAQLLAVKMWC